MGRCQKTGSQEMRVVVEHQGLDRVVHGLPSRAARQAEQALKDFSSAIRVPESYKGFG